MHVDRWFGLGNMHEVEVNLTRGDDVTVNDNHDPSHFVIYNSDCNNSDFVVHDLFIPQA